MKTLARLVARIGAGLLLLAALAGPMVVVATVAGNPFPGDLLDRLADRRINDATLVKVLSLGFYVCWAWFCAPVLHMIWLRLTRGQPRPAPGRTMSVVSPEVPTEGPRGALVRLARFVLFGAMVATAVTPAVAPAGASAPPVTRPAATVVAPIAARDGVDVATATVARADATSVFAEHRDTPFAVASKLFPATEVGAVREQIVTLNLGRPLPDGSMYRGGAFPAGWEVLIPAPSAPAPVDPAPVDAVPVEIAPAEVAQHAIVAGDTMWDLLDAHYGYIDADLVWAVADHNAIPDPSDIAVGTVVTLPASEELGRRPNSAAATVPAETVIVDQGDTLWDLAAAQLGAAGAPSDQAAVADYLADVIAHNPDVQDNPDLIYAGQQVDLPPTGEASMPPPVDVESLPPSGPEPAPTPAVDPLPEPAPTSVADTAPASTTIPATAPTSAAPMPVPVPQIPAAAPTATTTAAPAITESAPVPIPIPAPPPVAADQPGDVAPAPPPSTTVATTAGPVGDAVSEASARSSFAVPLAVGGISFAGVLFVLDRRRRRARPQPQLAPLPPDLDHDERIVRAAAHADRVERVNLAVRSLGDDLAGRDVPVRARMVLVDDDVIDVVLADRMEAPAGWQLLDDRPRWRCVLGIHELADFAETPSPWPAIVPLGSLHDGTSVLVDLEALGILAVTGDATVAGHVVSALTVALATSPYADFLTVVDDGGVDLHGLDELLAGHVRAADADELLVRLNAWIAPFDLAGQHLLTARRSYGGELEPCVAAVLSALSDHQRDRFAALPYGTMPIAAVTTDRGLARTHLDVRADGTARLDDLEVVCCQLDGPVAAVASRLLAHAEQPPAPELPDALAMLGALTEPDEAAGTTADDGLVEDAVPDAGGVPSAIAVTTGGGPPAAEPGWRVQVLGPLRIVDADGRELPTPLHRQLVTLLAVFRDGLTKDQIISHVWPDAFDDPGLKSRLTELRRGLGSGDTLAGRSYLPPMDPATGRYRVDAVALDSHEFCHLVSEARTAANGEAVGLLTDALGLVDGEPGAGEFGRFSWSSMHVHTLQVAITEAGMRLSELALARGDHLLAEWTATQARLGAPWDQRTMVLAVRARHAVHDVVGVRKLRDESLATFDDALIPELAEALDAALGVDRRRGVG